MDRRTFLWAGGVIGTAASIVGLGFSTLDEPGTTARDSEKGEPNNAEPTDRTQDDSETEFEAYRRDGHPGATTAYQQVGANDEFEYSPQVVGTRRIGGSWPMVPRSGPRMEETDWNYDHSGGSTLVQEIMYGMVEQPPNMMPVLKAYCELSASNRGEPFEVLVGTQEHTRADPLLRFVAGPDTETHFLYDECYLNDVTQGSASRRPDTFETANLRVWAGADADGNPGTLHHKSSVVLEWEVV